IELALAKADEQRLRKSLDSYQGRIDETPKKEQEFQELTRNYETTKDLYQNLTKRCEEAQLAESMEQRQKGEQFKIIDSAAPASSPTAPRRDRLLIVSIVLSLALARRDTAAGQHPEDPHRSRRETAALALPVRRDGRRAERARGGRLGLLLGPRKRAARPDAVQTLHPPDLSVVAISLPFYGIAREPLG